MLLKSPFTPVLTAVAGAVAALADWWGEVDNKVHLMQNDIALSSNTVVGDFVEADFGGYAAKTAAAAAAVFTDPLTGGTIIRIPDPSGGWAFVSTGTPPANTPQTIYGAYVVSNDGTKLLGAAKFATPINITEADQIIDVDDVTWLVNTPPVGV